jgi:RNA polymerase sigma factor (sigma-70 family)
MEYKKLPNELLIDKCVSKDGLAWAEFVRRTSPLITFAIKKALFKYSEGRHALQNEINDIRQGLFLSLWGKNKLSEIKNRGAIDYWLVTVARNFVINSLKRNHKEVLIYDQSFFEKLPAEEAGRKDETENSGKKIKAFYNLLKPREKLIFRLYFKKGLKLKDISKIMGIPIGTLSSAITRMRRKK